MLLALNFDEILVGLSSAEMEMNAEAVRCNAK